MRFLYTNSVQILRACRQRFNVCETGLIYSCHDLRQGSRTSWIYRGHDLRRVTGHDLCESKNWFLKSKFFDFWRTPKACISPLLIYFDALNTSAHIFVYNVYFFLWCLVMTVNESKPIALKGTDFWCRVPLNATHVSSEI